MSDDHDPLWDPRREGDDPLLVALRARLAPLSIAARGRAQWQMPRTSRTRRRRVIAVLAAAASVLAVLVALHHRLQWDVGMAWTVRQVAAAPGESTVAPGQRIATGNAGPAMIDVARIGRIELSADSAMTLVETRARHHRVALEYGHLRARIWAPPGDFGLLDADAEIIDLGCDFDVWKTVDGNGRLFVRSGWIAWRYGAHERLVPEGFGLRFAEGRTTTPLRADASRALVDAVEAIDAARAEGVTPSTELDARAAAVADAASAADAITLLSLLTEQPALASGPIYERLAQVWGIAPDALHRRAWASGDRAAVDAWWARLPRPPKRWWLHWRDAL